MENRPVIKMPDPMLRRKAHKVEKFDQPLRILVEDMIQTMREEPGVGLAAPQINISSRLIVVEYPLDDQVEDAKPALFVFANPEIIEKSTETEFGVEGCLSVPELLGEVERNTKIVISGFDQFGKRQTISASGWLARIFQHEIDHIDGILFVDRARKIWKPEPEESGEKITLE
jgi:peptide deformylase